MKTGKKIWSILLALVMVLGMMAPAAYAETSENPDAVTIESITASPVTFIEGVYSLFTTDDDGNELGVYHPLHKDVVFTVIYSDGSSAECEWYEIADTSDDLANWEEVSAWSVGEHIFQIELGGFVVDIPVTIVANPVASVTVEPFTAHEGIHQYKTTYWDEETQTVVEGLLYSLWSMDFQFNVTFTDGTTQTVSQYELDKLGLDFSIQMGDRDTKSWTAGNTYEVPMVVSGRECSAAVTVAENPVASVTAEPVTVYEGIHQHKSVYWDEETQTEAEALLFYLWDMDFRLNVTFSDGTAKTLTRDEAYELGLEFVLLMGDGDTKDWTAGNTYEVPMLVSGREFTAAVTVKENPVSSVRVPDIQLKASESWDGYYNFEEALLFEITEADGTVHTMQIYDLYDHDVYPEIYDPQHEGEQLVPGETYTVDYFVLGHAGQFKAEIIDDSIESITAEPQNSLYETLSSSVYYLEDVVDPIITVNRKDGTSVTFPYSERWGYLNSYVTLELADAPEGEYLPAGEYQVNITIEGAEGSFTLTVLENPVESFSVVTKYPFVKNEEGLYNYESVPYSVVLKLKDGTTKTYTDASSLWEDYHAYNTVPYLAIDPEAPLTAGTHEVQASLMGMVCKQTVTIVDANIASVSAVYNGTLIENVSGWIDGDYDENDEWTEYFRYSLDAENLILNVTFADGTTQTLGVYDSFMGSFVGNMISVEDTQSAQNPWKVGKNKVSGSMLGHSFELEVEVVENTIKDITVKATKPLYQGWHVVDAYEGGVYLDTRQAGLEITVTYTDDSTKTYTYDEFANEFNQVGVSPVEGSKAGKQTVSFWFINDSYEFEVEVKENPVKSVTIVPSKSLTESKNDGYDISETVPVYTVTYTDGTTATFYGNAQLIEKLDIYPSWDESGEFVVGENTVDVTVFGHTVQYTFEIVKAANPLAKISAKAVAPLYLYSDPYAQYYDYAALVEVTLTYADGTTKTVMANELRDAAGRAEIYFDDDQHSVLWGVGKHKATAYYMGFEADFTVEVVENPYVKLTISGDNGLTVTLEKKDGTKEVMTAKGYQVDEAAEIGTAGNLITDKGNIFVIFYFNNEDPENIAYMEYNGLRSNALEGCKWLSRQMALQGTGNVAIDKNAQELIQLVDKTAYRVWVTASELSSVADDVAAKILAATPEGYQQALLLDLNMYKQTGYGTFQVSEVSEPIGFTIPVPQALIASGVPLDSFKVIRLHNGAAEVLDASHDQENQTVSFQSDKFSTYALVYSAHTLVKVEAKAATTQATGLKEHYKCSVCGKLFADAEGKTETTLADVTIAKKPDSGSNAQTGDETPLNQLFLLMAVSSLLLSGVVAFGRKKFY